MRFFLFREKNVIYFFVIFNAISKSAIQIPVRYLRWSFLRKWLTICSRWVFFKRLHLRCLTGFSMCFKCEFHLIDIDLCLQCHLLSLLTYWSVSTMSFTFSTDILICVYNVIYFLYWHIDLCLQCHLLSLLTYWFVSTMSFTFSTDILICVYNVIYFLYLHIDLCLQCHLLSLLTLRYNRSQKTKKKRS